MLVVPVNDEESSSPLLPTERGLTMLDSRTTSSERFLAQQWEDLPIERSVSNEAQMGTSVSAPRFTVDQAHACRVQNRTFYVLEASGDVSTDGSGDVAELERCLSSTAREFIMTHSQEHSLAWVARYALIDSAEELPLNWLDSEARETDVSREVDSDVVNGHRVLIWSGWGNGAIRGWDLLPSQSRHMFAQGLIDAQFIWHDASQIMVRNENAFSTIISALQMPRRKIVRSVAGDCARNEIAASAHQLLFDDLLQNVQGIRRRSGESLLVAWGYDRTVHRMLERVQDAARQVDNLRARVGARYQAAVQATLLLLGFLVVVDTALSFIGTAYAGGVVSLPGGDSGLFELLRGGDADILLSAAIIVTIMLAVMFIRRPRD